MRSWENKCLNTEFLDTDQDFDHLISGIRSVIESQTVVVLDDMHLCKSRQLFNIVERIASAGIEQLHFVIIGRSYPLMDVEGLTQNGKAYCYDAG